MTEHPAPGVSQPRDPIEIAIRIGILAVWLYACLRIVAPFSLILLWSTLLSVLLFPLHQKLRKRISNGKSATLIGVVSVGLLLIPAILATDAVAESAYDVAKSIQNNTLTIGPPPPKLKQFGQVGAKLSDAWATAHTSLPNAMTEYGPVIKPTISKIAAAVGGLATSLLMFVASLVVAAILLAYGDRLMVLVTDLAARISGGRSRAEHELALTRSTIFSVAFGVVGVALIQAVLVGAGFFMVGFPLAALFTLIVLLFAIVQVPALLVTLPVIAWAFATQTTTTAAIFAVWMIVAGLSDNFLKPLLLGRGVEVPMPVILIGVIGGMLVDGLIGLFLGPVLLAIFWVLMLEWIHPDAASASTGQKLPSGPN